MQNLQQENRQRGKSALKMGGISVHEHNIVIPGISLCQKWGKIRIFHSTIVALGEPKYIRFLFNPEKRGLVVQACARKEAECFRVPKYNPENWEFKISSVPMLRMIWKTCEWDTEKTYRFTGICHSEYNLVEFDMKQATVLTVEVF